MTTKTNIKVQLIGEDGNAFCILGKVTKALRKAGRNDLADQYYKEATTGDYDHLLAITQEYVIVE